jgi:parallel beta-helix repeat protein
MTQGFTAPGVRGSAWTVSAFLMAFVAAGAHPAEAGQSAPVAVACTESALRTAIGQANAAGGGTITFTCRDTTIAGTLGLGDITDNVIIDGEDRNITLAYTGNFTGCAYGDNGVSGPPIGRMRGQRSVIRHLTFRNYLESLQISGPENTVEDNVFLAHSCSDDGLSTTTMQATSTIIRNNRLQGYRDKAYQMSYGGGTIEGNTFIDSAQPIRGPYSNTWNGNFVATFVIRNNVMTTTGDREACTGPHIDGDYQLVIEGNTIECYRGLRLDGGTQAIVRNNTITGNTRLGVRVSGTAIVSLSGNVITGNGLSPGSEPAGGVVVQESGQADLGGGSLVINGQAVTSSGGNRLQGNGVVDLRNLRTGYTVKAEGNCWDRPTAAEVTASDTSGAVDVDPLGTVCGSSTGQPPSPPTGVRLVTQG